MNIQTYIKEQLCDPWVGTIFEGYRFLAPKQKGKVGEVWVSDYMEKDGSTVLPADCGPNGPYDRIIDEYNTEIKFSCTQVDKGYLKEDVWTCNHVAEGKSWERLIFCGINLIGGKICPTIVYCTKKNFSKCLKETYISDKGKETSYFKRQQGGTYGGNDDWISTDKNLLKWINSKYTKDIGSW